MGRWLFLVCAVSALFFQCAVAHAQAGSDRTPATPDARMPEDADGPAGSTSRTVGDILRLLDSYAPDPTQRAALQRQATQPRPDTNDTRTLVDFYVRRANALGLLGSTHERLADLREAVRWSGRKDPNLMLVTSAVEWAAGHHVAAMALQEEMARHPGWDFVVNASLASNYASIGEFDKSERYQRQAVARATAERSKRADPELWKFEFQHILARSRAKVLLARGRYAEAEAAMRECIAAMEQDVAPAELRRSRGLTETPVSFVRNIYLTDLTTLAQILTREGKLAEAEVWARRSLRLQLEHTGLAHSNAGRALLSLAQVLGEQARFVEAEAVARRAIEVLENLGVMPHAVFLNDARLERANALTALGSWEQAVAEFLRRRDGLAGDPQFAQQVGVERLGWAIALLRSGEPQQARSMLETLERRLARSYGADHPEVAEVRGFLGITLLELGDKAQALVQFRRAAEGLLARRGLPAAASSPARALRLNMIVDAYIGLLHDVRGTALDSASSLDAAGEAFTLADAIRGHSTQRSMAAAGARAGAASNPQLAALIRNEQDLARESDALLEILVRLSAAPTQQQLPAVMAQMRERVDRIAKERKDLAVLIERAFPQYANLIQPRLVTIEEVRRFMTPGEVLISIFPGASRTYVWAVAKDGRVALHASALTAEQVAQQVMALRLALDVGDVPVDPYPAFDLATAHALYRELLLPVRAVWQDATSLLVATSGPLAQIPFALLPTQPSTEVNGPVPFAHYKTVPWLIKQIAIAQLPSVNALVTLRSMPASRQPRRAFAGFGDPVFDRRAEVMSASTPTDARDANLVAVRNLAIPRVTDDAIRRNRTVHAIPYSRLPPLPDTRDEVLAIAKALRADIDGDVFLGSDASKDKLRRADLASRRIIAFSTHGLLAGDFPGVDQPALALSAPADGSAENDPRKALLTLDDILALKLDADWVVLSACNTAAGDGKGSEAISGLGRAFFYAGSRALLVTHWPVESYSARLLVAGIFERYAADASLTRTEALRASMLALMNGETDGGADTYAHPMFWAPYALVGDSGR